MKTLNLSMEEGDWEFLATGIKDIISRYEESKSDPVQLARFSDWVESTQSLIEENQRILSKIEGILGYRV